MVEQDPIGLHQTAGHEVMKIKSASLIMLLARILILVSVESDDQEEISCRLQLLGA